MGVCFACIGLLDGIVSAVDLLRREGGLVALGTDLASSNNCITLFSEMKLTALFNKIKSRSPDVILASAGTNPKHPPQPRVCGNRARSRQRDGRWPVTDVYPSDPCGR